MAKLQGDYRCRDVIQGEGSKIVALLSADDSHHKIDIGGRRSFDLGEIQFEPGKLYRVTIKELEEACEAETSPP